MNQEFYDAVEANPVIAAVKHDDGLQAAVEMEEIQVIFVSMEISARSRRLWIGSKIPGKRRWCISI